MEARGGSTHTPKAVLHQKFGTKACYKVEEVQQSPQVGFPGLAIQQKPAPCLYRCTLQLPEFSVVSETFKKKKDAEQSAAAMAIEKLGIKLTTDSPSVEEAWEGLVARVSYFFSEEFLSSLHPLSSHVRAALQRDGDLYGLIPVSAIAAYDAKLTSLSKLINPKAGSNPLLVLSLIMKSAAKLSEFVVTSTDQLSIKRKHPFQPDIITSSAIPKSGSPEIISVQALYVPRALEKTIQPVTLNMSSTSYYLDVIAEKLGLTDANKVLISRLVGKASSETRFYYTVSESFLLDLSSDNLNANFHSEGTLNKRASYLCGEDIHGDAVFASAGYTWRSNDIFYENVSPQMYYRMLIGKTPSGIYKLSREAMLTAEFPSAFTTKANWRGALPKEILCTFCRQHRLSEPVFSFLNIPSKESSESSRSLKKVKVTEPSKEVTPSESLESGTPFWCEVKIFSKSQDLMIECSPKEIYKKQSDSLHNVSLKVLTWLNTYFKDPDIPLEKLNHCADALEIRFCSKVFLKEFGLCQSIHTIEKVESHRVKVLDYKDTYDLGTISGSGVCPSNGSILSLSYSIFLKAEGENYKVPLESSARFEFETGNNTVVPQLETAVSQMSVGQSACFSVNFAAPEFILAAAVDSVAALSLLSSNVCCLEYHITFLNMTAPAEERMEQAHFSPPLSKQRVEYAVQHIKESCATTLVDFGCGSGSLLDSLLGYTTSLEKIVGVDISPKGLSRAAKVLHSKLSTNTDTNAPCIGIRSAVLYDGSITDFDSRLHGFDIGTCLEVIEHMEEEQACIFGDVVLSSFRPKILIVSTPNFEYNVILQTSNNNMNKDEKDTEEKIQSKQAPKFRNHDHKFEWTREQFNQWASGLASKHNYSVEFSGVGGSGNVEPGFASQIAVFRRGVLSEDDIPMDEDSTKCYQLLWEWKRQ